MKKFNGVLAAFLAIVVAIGGGIGGFFGYQYLNPIEGDVYTNGDLQVHCLEGFVGISD